MLTKLSKIDRLRHSPHRKHNLFERNNKSITDTLEHEVFIVNFEHISHHVLVISIVYLAQVIVGK